MKVAINLIATRPRLALPLAIAVWTLGIVFAVFAIGFATLVVELKAEHPRLEGRLARLNEQLQVSAPVRPLPSDAVLASARERVKTFNAIVGARGMTSVQMLAWLEK